VLAISHHHSLRNNPEERSFQLLLGGSLTLRMKLITIIVIIISKNKRKIE
jgi:hypothetical protein